MDAVCLGTASDRLPRPGHRYMQLDAFRACIMDVHYGTVAGSDSGRSLSVLSVELRLIVVVVYTWSATVMSAALQNVTVIKPRRVQQKLMNSSKIDGQRWPIRIQRDFLTFITKSNASSSRSQLCNIFWSSVTVGNRSSISVSYTHLTLPTIYSV